MDEKLRERYSRNLALYEVGETGQEKLLQSHVLVVGAGGLGSPVLLYLTCMGIGHIGIVDGDVVGLSNLNRQILYSEADLGKPKANQAAQRLQQQSPQTTFTVYPEFLTPANVNTILPGYDVVVDFLDNFNTRFLLNDACLDFQIPFIYAGVYKYEGQLLTVIPGKTPCLRCLFPDGEKTAPDQKAITEDGILGTTPGVLGALQANAVFKLLLDLPQPRGSLFYFDTLSLTSESIPLTINPSCRCQKK
jgi:molybdopterin/thiamine biosynthesis adenylyltransferase